MVMISRRDYAAMYGPTTGDRVRLGDTNLIARVERDHAHYGEECLTGLGKTMRDGLAVNAGHTAADGAVDVVHRAAGQAGLFRSIPVLGAHFGLGMYISALSVLVLHAFCSVARAFCSFRAFLLDYASFLGRVGGFEDDKIRLFGCNSRH